MPIAYVSGGNGATHSGVTTLATSAFAATAGGLIVGGVRQNYGHTATVSVADTAGNTYILLPEIASGVPGESMQPFYCLNCLGHASNVVTITFSNSEDYVTVVADCYTGVAAFGYIQNLVGSGAGNNDIQTNPLVTDSSALLYLLVEVGTINNGQFLGRTNTTTRQLGTGYEAASGDYIASSAQTNIVLGFDATAPYSWIILALVFFETAVNPATISSGLVSYWPLDEISATRYDAYGANDLTDIATVGSATGKVGLAADFESDNSEMLMHASNSSLQVGDIDFTFAFWMKMESVIGGYPTVLGKDILDANREFTFYLDPTPRLAWVVFDSSQSQNGCQSDVLSAGVWYFVVGGYDAVNNLVFLQINNGGPVAVVHTTGVNTASSDFTVGMRGDSNNAFDGLVDEIGFWKRRLSIVERAWLYNQGAGRAYADLGTATAALTGTGAGGMTEGEVVAGGKTLIITLTDATWPIN